MMMSSGHPESAPVPPPAEVPVGTFRQRTELTKPQRDLLAKLVITPPKQIVEPEPA